MPDIYKTALSPLLELARAALPGKRAVTAEDMRALLDPTTGAQRRVNVGGLQMQVHPEEWKFLQASAVADDLRKDPLLSGTRDDVVEWLRSDPRAPREEVSWTDKGKGHAGYILPGLKTNYRVRGLEGADGLSDSGSMSYHFNDSPVHARLSARVPSAGGFSFKNAAKILADLRYPSDPEQSAEHLRGLLSNRENPLHRALSLSLSLSNIPPNSLTPAQHAQFENLIKNLRGSGPRATHIDELQSDFYSMPAVPASHRERLAQIEAEIRALPPRDASNSRSAEETRLFAERAQIPNFDTGRPQGPFEKLWPRLAFNQSAREALESGDDLVTWSPPAVHNKLYKGNDPGQIDFTPESNMITYVTSSERPVVILRQHERGISLDGINPFNNPPSGVLSSSDLHRLRSPITEELRRRLATRDALGPAHALSLTDGTYFTSPDSLMYHSMYGPNGTVEDAAKRFARSYGEDPKSALTTTRLEGAGWDNEGYDVPGLRISESMRDIYKRLRDEKGAGVPLYSSGGHVTKPITLEDFILKGVQ